ncbi:MAG: hypothetical protein AAB250_07900 [Bdellovibrionota bacterium]
MAEIDDDKTIAPERPPLKSTDTRPYDEGRIQYEDEVKHEGDIANRPSNPNQLPNPTSEEARKLVDPRDTLPPDE